MSGYVLYGRLETGSASAEAALAAAGANFEVRDVPGDRAEAEASGFHLVNPRGQVPALVLPDGTVVTESPAILLHVADAFPRARLAPLPGTSARAVHDRWLCYLHANCYEGELRRFYPERYTDDPAGAAAVGSAAEDYVRRHYVLLASQVAFAPYAFGEDPTVLDIYLWMLIQWSDRGWASAHVPGIVAMADRMSLRPAIAPVQERHFG